jgi:hypothetical protein
MQIYSLQSSQIAIMLLNARTTSGKEEISVFSFTIFTASIRTHELIFFLKRMKKIAVCGHVCVSFLKGKAAQGHGDS